MSYIFLNLKHIYHIPFLPLLKISLGNPYLKILDLTTLFVVDAPMKKSTNLVLLPLRAPWNMGLTTTLRDCDTSNHFWHRKESLLEITTICFFLPEVLIACPPSSGLGVIMTTNQLKASLFCAKNYSECHSPFKA